MFNFFPSWPPFLLFFSFCLSVPAGWWLSGDLHQPSGDCKDPSTGGRRDHHGAEGQRPVRHQGPRLLWALQGEKHRWGQRFMHRWIHTMQLDTKGSYVTDSDGFLQHYIQLIFLKYNIFRDSVVNFSSSDVSWWQAWTVRWTDFKSTTRVLPNIVLHKIKSCINQSCKFKCCI